MSKICLIRYDTECNESETMDGFFEKMLAVHREDEIPVTLFCTGRAIDSREDEFRSLGDAVKGDKLFDLQDHSYSHIGVCYEAGKPVEVLREDYAKSFAAHNRVIGKSPKATSICGTSGADGDGLSGFDATEKSRAEFEMLASLGLTMINTRLTGLNQAAEFCNYSSLGHPEVMGYPSAYSDTEWMLANGDTMGTAFIKEKIREHAEKGRHFAVVCHDWCAWTKAPDQELTHIRQIAEAARAAGYELRTVSDCYADRGLWA